MGRRRVRAHPRSDDAQRGLARRPARAASVSSSCRSRSSPLASALCGAATVAALADPRARRCRASAAPAMFAVSLAIISQEFHGRERGTAFGIWGATVGAGRRDRAARRRRADDVRRLALDLLRQHPDRDRVRRGGHARVCTSRGTRSTAGFDLPGLRDADRRRCSRSCSGCFRGSDWGWSSGRVVGLFVAAAVLLVAFASIELRAQRRRCSTSALFRVPTFTGAQITAFAISSGMFAQFLFLTLYLQNVLGYSRGQDRRALPAALAASRSSSRRSRDGCRHGCPCASCSAAGSRSSASRYCSCTGSLSARPGRHCSPGFIVGGIGIGLVNAPLASTVGERRRAAAGRDGVGHQQHVPPGRDRDGHRRARRDLPEPDRVASRVGRRAEPGRRQVGAGSRLGREPPDSGLGAASIWRDSAFISGLNAILLVAAIVALRGRDPRVRARAAAGLRRERPGSRRPLPARPLRRPRRWRCASSDPQRQLPGAMQQHHGGAGHDDERLSGDRERDRVRRAQAAEHEDRGARARLRRGACGRDRQRRRRGRRARGTRARARRSPASRARSAAGRLRDREGSRRPR